MNLLAELSMGESISLANLSFLSLFVSMILYWVGTSFQDFNTGTLPLRPLHAATPQEGMPSGKGVPLLPRRGTASVYPEGVKPKASGEALSNAGGVEGNNQSEMPVPTSNGSISNFSYKLAQYGIISSNLLLGLLLALRWKESGHFPLSNLYESLMFLSWCFTGIHLLIENFQRNTKGGMTKTLVGALTTPSALLTNAFATFTLPKEMQESSPLVPALQSNWLMMHVTVMIISYAALIIGSLLSIAFLIITFEQPNEKNQKAADLSFFNGTAASSTNSTVDKNTSNKKQVSKVALLLDNLSYRILGIGFPFLTIGILSGAVWANEAWGSYWSWDPKETWALLTWLIFAIYLHTRLSKGWEGKKPAIIASFGFVIVWICYLGVNLIGEGLHSYGWITT